VTVGGQFLDGVTNVHISGGGTRGTVIEHTKPLTQQQFNTLRDKMRELQEKRQTILNNKRRFQAGAPSFTNLVWTAQDEKSLAEIRKKVAAFQRRPVNPAIGETVFVQVALAASAEPGERELRMQTPAGLSNPLVFRVGQLPEYIKPQPVVGEEAFPFKQAKNNSDPKAAPPSEVRIIIPATVNGQILPGGVDRYRFAARKGQHVVAAVSARDLIPYLADAVPGWFQASLTLYDAKGKELAYDDDYHCQPDPVLYYEIPRDGDYLIEIRDALYRGREDFIYRIAVGELPFVGSIFPLGGQSDRETKVEVKGWNLPVANVVQTNRELGIHPISVRKEELESNHVPFAVDSLPDIFEQEPNDSPENAQPVTLPVIVNGRIARSGDWDVFRIEGRAGEKVVAEVFARRLGSPLDSVLKLTDAGGRQLAFNDDCEDKGCGLNTHHADSRLRATLPADANYYLHLGDAQHHGAEEFAYRLRVSVPQPDFDLRITPSSVNARPGMCVPLTVYALRKDGCSNEIEVVLKGAPPGFKLSGGRVPAGEDQLRLTLTAPSTPPEDPVSLVLEGRATIQGQEVVRPVVPAEDMMQAFAYRHLVPAKEFVVAVSGRGMLRSSMKVLGECPLKIPAGGTARVEIAAPSGGFADRFQFELNEPPDGVTIRKATPVDGGLEIVLQSDAGKAKPGLAGNLIVNILPGRNPAASSNGKKQPNQRRTAIATLPAIPFQIVSR
jgi:hypothetical protein